MIFSKTENWAQTVQKLSLPDFISKLKWQYRMQILEWLLRGGVAFGMIVLLIYLYVQLNVLEAGKLLTYLFAAVGAVILLLGVLRKKGGDAESRLFEKYGNAADLLDHIQRGADHIELETRHFVMTDTYIIDKNDYAAYVPYEAIRSFGMDDGTAGSLLSQSAPIPHLLVTDSSGEEMRYLLEPQERHCMAEAQMLIRKYAPQAVFGR